VLAGQLGGPGKIELAGCLIAAFRRTGGERERQRHRAVHGRTGGDFPEEIATSGVHYSNPSR
jgi:hypothetical protein